MKTFLLAFLSLCFAVGMVAVAQDLPNQVPQKRQQAGIRLTSLMDSPDCTAPHETENW